MTGLASLVLLYSAKLVITKGINLVRQIGTKKIDLKLSKETTYIQIKDSIQKKPSLNIFKKLYPIEEKNKKVILYKAVHKKDNIYFSDKNRSFTYEIGKIKEERCDSSQENSCSYGLHISHKNWAILFGRGWEDMALLECEVSPKDIVVSKDCDGKCRTSKLKVIREVPHSEWY
jgi:hypothetical protein